MKAVVVFCFVISAWIPSLVIGDEPFFLGKFQLASDPMDPAFNEYLKAMEFTDEHRETIRKLKTTFEITKDGDKFVYTIVSTVKTHKETFKLGEEFTTSYVDGRKCKARYIVTGNALVQFLDFGAFQSKAEFTFSPEGAKMAMSCKDKTAVREYKRL